MDDAGVTGEETGMPVPECLQDVHCDECELCVDGVCVPTDAPKCPLECDSPSVECLDQTLCLDAECIPFEQVPQCAPEEFPALGEYRSLTTDGLAVLVFDANADGADDLLLDGDGAVAWLAGPGSGPSVALPLSTANVAAADLDDVAGDELVWVDSANDRVLVYENDGAGHFEAGAEVTGIAGGWPRTGDFDGDGNLDVAVLRDAEGWILAGDGAAGLTQVQHRELSLTDPGGGRGLHRRWDRRHRGALELADVRVGSGE